MSPPNEPKRTARRALPRSLDTTMGLTPAGSLVMNTRSVDPAPGLMVYLLHGKGIIPAAALGGLDTFPFTGGIGENSATIRERICAPLGFLGIRLDQGLNEINSPVISRKESPVTVRVMKTNEELMIASHTRDLLTG